MGGFFATALLTGVWKYAHIHRTEDGTASAPAYVSTAHRAAFAYAFSCMLMERFAELRNKTQMTPTFFSLTQSHNLPYSFWDFITADVL